MYARSFLSFDQASVPSLLPWASCISLKSACHCAKSQSLKIQTATLVVVPKHNAPTCVFCCCHQTSHPSSTTTTFNSSTTTTLPAEPCPCHAHSQKASKSKMLVGLFRPYAEKSKWKDVEQPIGWMRDLFVKYVPPTIFEMKKAYSPVTPLNAMNYVTTLVNILEGCLKPENLNNKADQPMFEMMFAFAMIWAFGGALCEKDGISYRYTHDRLQCMPVTVRCPPIFMTCICAQDSLVSCSSTLCACTCGFVGPTDCMYSMAPLSFGCQQQHS